MRLLIVGDYSIYGQRPATLYYTAKSGKMVYIGEHEGTAAARAAVDRYQEARRQAAAMGCRVHV